jgi:molybdopterin molybdotransferase
MPLVDALTCIERLVAPVAPRPMAADAALGRTLAGDVMVAHGRPAAALALRDGFALRAEATLDASSYAPVRLDAAAVEVGDRLPAGADAVAPPEAIELRAASVSAVAPLAPGDGVLPVGTDAAPGDVVGRAATRARASDLAALAALGVNEIQVREPRIRVACAAADQDAAAERDGVIAAIAGLLTRAVHDAGGVAVTPSGRGSLDGALDDAGADAIILVGGSGSGSRDHSVHALARLGRVAFHGVAISPGETAAFGTIETRPVLVVPGRLDAALTVWLMLGRRMLARLCGYHDDERSAAVTLTRKIASTLGLAEIVPVAREADGVAPLASGYLPLQALARADGYVIVPADSEGYPAGAQVEMRPLP